MRPIINNFLRSEMAEIGYYLIFSLPISDTFMNNQAIVKSGDRYYLSNIILDPFPIVEVNGKTYRANLSHIISAGETKSFSIAVVLNETSNIPSIIDQNWIDTNQANLSEWSDVISYTALREAPILAIEKLTLNSINVINTPSLTLNGGLKNEKLLWYKVFLIKDDNGTGVQENVEVSNKIYLSPADNNIFTYRFQYIFQPNNDPPQGYELNIIYSTENGYTRIVNYKLQTGINFDNDIIVYNPNFNIQSISEQGLISFTVHFENLSTTSKTGELIVLRSSQKDNYEHLEILSRLKMNFNSGYLDCMIIDKFIESGIGYKYKVYFQNSDNNSIGSILEMENPVCCCFDHILISDSQEQIKIKYNPDVSNYKYNIGDTITQTLGSRFPYFRRNGQMKYRTFTIGGLISYHAEEDDLFSNSYSNSSFASTDLFNIPVGLDDATKEVIKEKIFRDKILNFLYSAKPKLFRSLIEGNMIIKLTNISLTPNKQLGRLIYSFAATATEVEEATIEGCLKHNLFPIDINIVENTSSQISINNYYILADTTSDKDGSPIVNSNEFDTDGALFVHKETFNI